VLSREDDLSELLVDLLPNGRGLLVMLRVFLDKGAKSDGTDQVVCVAAAVFKPDPYKKFVRQWNTFLREWNADFFHATDFYGGAEPFKRDTPERNALFQRDTKRIPNIVGSNVHRIELVSFRPHEFFEKAPPKWKEVFGHNLHALAIQLCALGLGWWAEENCPHQTFAYVMETGGEGEGEAFNRLEEMKRDLPTRQVIRISSTTQVEKKVARGTEVADLLAWHWNKYYVDKVKLDLRDKPRKDFWALVKASRNQVFEIFLSGENLEYFFSQVRKSGVNI
jgi:hypothetical protein